MECRQAARQLAAFQDGELAVDVRGAVEQHLRGCLGCRRRLRSFERVGEALAALPEFAAPSGRRLSAPRPARLFPAATLLGLLLAVFACLPTAVDRPSVRDAGPRVQWSARVRGHDLSVATQGDVEILQVSFSQPGGPGFSLSYR